MCGIVGIIGRHEVAPLILEALKRLEYRGYDSAGIATVHEGRLDRRRAVGKLVNLSDRLVHEPLPGRIGIGHTRWATHGPATEANAHPHRTRRVAVVHNGIIENFGQLRDELAAQGYHPGSETDTEIAALLVERNLDRGLDPVRAALEAVDRLEGAFALAFLFEGEDDLMVVARRGSPLVIGRGEGEIYVGSDAIALAPFTDRITYLEDGDRAVLHRSGARILDARGREARRPVERLSIDAHAAEKAGYRHFMAKEIHEQPAVIERLTRHYLDSAGSRVEVEAGGLDFRRFRRLIMVACGTAHYATHLARHAFEGLARLPVEIDVASELRYRDLPLDHETLAIAVSQSGETADTLAALRHMREGVGGSVAVVNVETSSIAREAEVALPILAGPEIGVASTKAFTAQAWVLTALACLAGRQRGVLAPDREAEAVAALGRLPRAMADALALEGQIAALAADLATARDVLFLGRGGLYPLALEAALKLKEISYIHAEGYAAGELKHGPIALVEENLPVIVFAPSGPLFEKTVSNIQEVLARKGRVLMITDRDGAARAPAGLWQTLVVPEAPPLTQPILHAVPAQLLAYHVAVHKGTDVDQPRNLAKSVTVE